MPRLERDFYILPQVFEPCQHVNRKFSSKFYHEQSKAHCPIVLNKTYNCHAGCNPQDQINQ